MGVMVRSVVVMMFACAACGSSSAPPVRPEPALAALRPTEFEERLRRVVRRCDELLRDEKLRSLASKLPVDLVADSITPAMLAIDEAPTAAERERIVILVARHSACHREETEVLGSLSGPPSSWYTQQRAKHLELLANLHAGQLTFGAFNAALKVVKQDADRERGGEELARVRMTADQAASVAAARARRAEEVQRAYDAFVSAHAAPETPRATPVEQGR